MDQHPIPQDVTGFQFKLIGSMTVKQFGYVAVGVITAVIMHYAIPNSGVWPLLKYVLLIPIAGGSGFIVAFIPVEGRPIDVMASNFAKALFSPNQYVYHKEPRPFSFTTVNFKPAVVQTAAQKQAAAAKPSAQQSTTSNKEQQLQALLLHSQASSKGVLDQKEQAFLDKFASAYASAGAAAPLTGTPPVPAAIPQSTHLITVDTVPSSSSPAGSTPVDANASHMPVVSTYVAPQPAAPVIPPVTPAPTPPIPQAPESLKQKEAVLEQQLEQAKQEEAQTKAPATSPVHQKVLDLEKQVQEIHIQKQQLEQELVSLKNQLSTQAQPPAEAAKPAPTVPIQADTPKPQPVLAQPPSAAPQPSQYVRNIPQGMTKNAGLPSVSDTPNVVVGIVKDPRGNLLPHILIEVKDADGNPVRAFKTNVLGQFASATPLSNGMYTIELDDPKKQHVFDKIQIVTNGQIMMPIEIISHDAREELRKQLFN